MGGAVARYKLKLKYKHKRKHTYYARTHTNASSSFQAKPANEKMLLPGCLPVRVAVCLCVMLAALLLPLSLARTVVVCRRGWLFLVRLCVCVCLCKLWNPFSAPPILLLISVCYTEQQHLKQPQKQHSRIEMVGEWTTYSVDGFL